VGPRRIVAARIVVDSSRHPYYELADDNSSELIASDRNRGQGGQAQSHYWPEVGAGSRLAGTTTSQIPNGAWCSFAGSGRARG